jgi:UPF0755 protein
MKKRQRRLLWTLGCIAGVVLAFWIWFAGSLRPPPRGNQFFIRYYRPQPIKVVLEDLASRGVIRSVGAARLYLLTHRGPNTVPVGTYSVQPGQSIDEILHDVRNPVRQMLRMPETNWARRDANLLEKAHVATAQEYLALVNDPAHYWNQYDFPLPSGSLEGYLYPDTYDFPPLIGADAVIRKRLQTFESKVYDRIGRPTDLARIVKVASLVELEAGTDEDRPMIAGVIYNRLRKNMPLEIDAGIMYALGKWKRLHFKDYKNVKSPYNLYLNKGLPPTPICSPSFKSIAAATHPSRHEFLYYVALPNGQSLFSKTFAEHRKKIKIRLQALKASQLLDSLLGLPAGQAKPNVGKKQR